MSTNSFADQIEDGSAQKLPVPDERVGVETVPARHGSMKSRAKMVVARAAV